MRRLVLSLLLALTLTGTSYASFYARNLTDPSNNWSIFAMKQLTCEVEVLGLFYQTTITFEIALTNDDFGHYPAQGTYEIVWDFDLVEEAVVTDASLKPADATGFISAQIVDLSTAEKLYEQYPTHQPRLLLRHRWQRGWRGQVMKRFEGRFSPVYLTKTPVVKIRYLSPCLPYYNVRRLFLPLAQFSVYRPGAPVVLLRDADNPNFRPQTISSPYSISWTKVGADWRATLTVAWRSYYDVMLGVAPESPDRSYLRTFAANGAQFYQMSVLPPIAPEERKPKNILLAVDLTEMGYGPIFLMNQFEKAVRLSTSGYDSITMLYSAFTPVIYDSAFVPVREEALNEMFNQLYAQPIPKLNTLPHLLRQAVNIFNLHKKSGELWLLTNAYTHSDPPATAMEIINQTLGAAEKPIVFRIVNSHLDWWPHWWINAQYYYGNDYLYENLARLSWGSYVKLRNYPDYDFLDVMLDCIAPAATAVETDAEPAAGLSYSRFQLNRGRTNFPITLPYYEIGLFDGSDPFLLHFYGIVDGELFAKDVTIDRQSNDTGWQAVATYWYDRYIQNLLLEPQSYETIQYIETVSVQERLLTPYSGFIIPGPSGLLAFKRLDEEIESAVETPQERVAAVPEQLELTAYPNPFNAATTISFALPNAEALSEVRIVVINCLGQIVCERNLSKDALRPQMSFRWDGLDQLGNAAATGIYLVHIQAGEESQNLKITLLR